MAPYAHTPRSLPQREPASRHATYFIRPGTFTPRVCALLFITIITHMCIRLFYSTFTSNRKFHFCWFHGESAGPLTTCTSSLHGYTKISLGMNTTLAQVASRTTAEHERQTSSFFSPFCFVLLISRVQTTRIAKLTAISW